MEQSSGSLPQDQNRSFCGFSPSNQGTEAGKSRCNSETPAVLVDELSKKSE